MDRIISTLPAEEDADLMLCIEYGVAYQKDRGHVINYDESYWNKCAGYEGQGIARKINDGRIDLVGRHVGTGPVLDIGVGAGEFIRHRRNTFGYDVNPFAADWLKRQGFWADDFKDFDGYTMWDVLEHVPDPDEYLRHISVGSYLFVCLPLFQSLRRIRESKHYRPGEHLQYFTDAGFIAWIDAYGFRLVERAKFEIDAGRDSIYSFAFKRWRKP